MSAQRNGYRPTGSGGVTARVEAEDGVVGVGSADHRQPPGGVGIAGTVIVWVTVLVLVLVLTLVLGVVVVVVVVGSVVVVVAVVVVGSVVGVVVSVTVLVDGAITRADVDVVVMGVIDVVCEGVSPVISLASPYTKRAMRTAPSAPNATSAAGLRYHGIGSSGGGPGG
jgi:hypothetical protein